MKSLHVKRGGLPENGWKFGTFKGWNCGGNLPKARHISGWQLKSPDGCYRLCEGNWQQFVPFANLVLENYGVDTRIS